MKQTETIIPYGYVYKVTYPDGRIYVGGDLAQTAEFDYYKYFGGPSLAGKMEMHKSMLNTLGNKKIMSVTKELLYEARNCTISHIRNKEREFIKAWDAKNPNVGYNRN